eukprot:4195228-Lingulodinium_polyedra.AAC.1
MSWLNELLLMSDGLLSWRRFGCWTTMGSGMTTIRLELRENDCSGRGVTRGVPRRSASEWMMDAVQAWRRMALTTSVVMTVFPPVLSENATSAA